MARCANPPGPGGLVRPLVDHWDEARAVPSSGEGLFHIGLMVETGLDKAMSQPDNGGGVAPDEWRFFLPKPLVTSCGSG